jgi:hypothetical protein
MLTPEDTEDETAFFGRCDYCRAIVKIKPGDNLKKCPLCHQGRIKTHAHQVGDTLQCNDSGSTSKR